MEEPSTEDWVDGNGDFIQEEEESRLSEKENGLSFRHVEYLKSGLLKYN